MTNEQILREAIAALAPVSAMYQQRKRLFCPHMLGYKGSELHVLGYQFGGFSSSTVIETPSDPSNGPPDYWRCMDVRGLTFLTVIPGIWYTCKKHTERSSCADTVLAEVPRV